MSFLRVLTLKFRELFASPVVLIALLVLPILMGMAAGASNLHNRDPVIRVVVTDLDRTEVSRGLVAALERQGWEVLEADKEEARGLLDRKAVEGALVIEQGFAARMDSLVARRLTYTPAEGALTANRVLDALTYAVIPFKSRAVFLRQAEEIYKKSGLALPENFEERFDREMQSSLDGSAKQEFIYVGKPAEPPALSYAVNDYSLELLFLGFFALLGNISLSAPAIWQRLAAAPRGLARDYAATQIALFTAGLLQLLLYMGSMRALMGTVADARELYILSVFLLMSLAFAQALALLHESVRLFLGLILLFVLSVAGGCFIQLPERLIRLYGQYIPQGWALAALRGYPVPSAAYGVSASIAILVSLYFIRARKAVRSG